MKKMKTVFVIDYNNNALASDVVSPEAAWVFEEENVVPTLKIDGTAAFYKDGKLYKRWDRKLKKPFARKAQKLKGDFKPEAHMFKEVPDGAIPCEDKPDPVTHHHPHWVPVGNGNEDQMFREALENSHALKDNTTYELIGPKVQGNVYELSEHQLVKHGGDVINNLDFSFQGIKNWLENHYQEGIVFHSQDGKKAKIRRKDFGLNWNNESQRK